MHKKVLDNSGKLLANILGQCKQLAKLQAVVEPLLPIELRAHVHIASYQQGCLNFVASGPIWATRLRYQFPELITGLRASPRFRGLKSCNVLISLENQNLERDPRRAYISEQASSTIKEFADTVADDDLQAALIRLSKHTKA